MIGPEVAQTARDRSVMFCEDSVRWLYRLEDNFSWESGLSISQDYAFKDKTGVVRTHPRKRGPNHGDARLRMEWLLAQVLLL